MQLSQAIICYGQRGCGVKFFKCRKCESVFKREGRCPDCGERESDPMTLEQFNEYFGIAAVSA